MVHLAHLEALYPGRPPRPPPCCTLRGQEVVHLSPPTSEVPKERPSVLSTALLKPGRYGRISELSPSHLPANPCRHQDRLLVHHHGPRGRCLWRSSVNTCPTALVSGSSPRQLHLGETRSQPASTHPVLLGGHFFSCSGVRQAGVLQSLHSSELMPESPTWPPPEP